jgi:streptogramin lyase
MMRAATSFAIAIALTLILGAADASAFRFITAWDTTGISAAGTSVATDAAGNVYTTGGSQVQKFSPDGTLLGQWGSEGSGDGQFSGASGIAVDTAGNVYVADHANNRVQKFSSDGAYLLQFGGPGDGDGQFSGPWGVATDTSGNVYVTDQFNNRVEKFDSSGVFLDQWGTSGSGDGQLSDVRSIAIDPAGDVYVADRNNDRIEKFSPDGTYLLQWGSQGTGDDHISGVGPVATDPAGNIYVSDAALGHAFDGIKRFTSTGVFLDKFGEAGFEDSEVDLPGGLATDTLGNVYIADDNGRIKKWGPGLPAPTSGETVNLELVKGKVSTKCKGDPRFTPLTNPEQVAVGCLVDTTKGRVELVSATGNGNATQSAEYYDGVFQIKQKPNKAEVTLTLEGKLDCAKGPLTKGHTHGGRGLFGSGNAATTTRGNNGAGTVRGKTSSFIGDTCDDTTIVVVKKGTVSFRDFVADKTVIVHAGDSYETEPK